ncbi:cation:proton antiporter [Roseomonas sp. CCTCC AB2023176]|uniref:cation:proton antiporter domain-containing protein n=1 Tax=Roseomonas sp. CCTCC AB2023176 TaxID=3342640 RepID=UPI0035E2F107
MPGLDPVACLAVGVAVAVAEPRIAVDTGAIRALPRAMADALSAQLASAPLVGVSLSLIAAKAVGGPLPTAGGIALTFLKDLAIGGTLGAALGFAIAALRRRLTDAPAEAALSFATPFAAAAVGDVLGLNPIAVLIAAGLVLAWRSVDRETGSRSPRRRRGCWCATFGRRWRRY